MICRRVMEFYQGHPRIGKVSFCSKLKISAKNDGELLFGVICKTDVEELGISKCR